MFRFIYIYSFVLLLLLPLGLKAQDAEKKDSIGTQNLQEVTITARKKQDIGHEKIGQVQLATEMTSDIRDLVRYIPGVGISYSGTRGGSRGFAIRGVEANRVAITVDGVPQPEIHENMVFSAYGLSNASRVEFDPYFVSAIDIQKGAASFNSGTGALGGAVNYTTKRINDLIRPGNSVGATIQTSYNSKDNLKMVLGGAAVKLGKFEGLAMFATRYGDQIKNFEYGELTRNVTSTRIDPMDYEQQTFLGKVAYIPNTFHRIEFSYYMLNKKINSEIWSQEPLDIFTSDGKPYYYSHDQALNHSYTLNYNYIPNSEWMERFNVRVNLQNTYMDARTWSEYYNPNFFGNGQYELIYEGRRDKYRGLEIKDKLAKATLDFKPLSSEIFGTHTFSINGFYANKFNDSRNVDVENPYASNKIDGYTIRMGVRYEFGESMGKYTNAYSYQRPVSRDNYSVSFMDKIKMTNYLNMVLGIRQDFFQTKDKNWNYRNDQYYMDNLMQNIQGVSMNSERISDNDHGTSFIGTATYEFDKYLQLSYKFSTGFRMPTTEERHFQYYSSWPSFLVLSNRNLKPETSINHEIEIAGSGKLITYMFNLYFTNYKNFIDIEQGTIDVANSLDNSTKKISYSQNMNRNSADLWGIDAKMYLYLQELCSSLRGFSFNAAVSYAKGSTSYGTSMLGVQPLTGFLGLEYLSPNEKWNVNAKINAFFAKDRKDTRFIEKTATKEIQRTFPTLFLNDSYTFDLYASYSPLPMLTIRAGVYNLFNTKYWRWDDLRQLTNPALLPHIESFFREGKNTITRFSQPKRYFSTSVELRF
ncbi:TonB-dependent hemoglobin/transferrin/lactoferrin family receptor [Dysgonomonas sp. BGC7]|uniref:TonB-dependent hemoglobin/transferrin/lactoferrin family receptor n=1 Tax=Dysgonomonas sp. BGC7 TaxID=1658008 RepID=UPI000680EF5F|nr:TonB-dependent hemoglobin/transferrin/lactoferrin family receptor [Dysgonomonas sp. BGC7]MBD8389149.1 TonB-dependent hemoglobin/transferrin/lactoferrin family receptor [Dysgonomonas sp. BGC7]